MEPDAAPAGVGITHLTRSGGAGAPPGGGTTTPCEELADGGPFGPPEARRCGCPKGAAPESRRRANGPSESAARRRQDAAMERRGARVLSPKDARASPSAD